MTPFSSVAMLEKLALLKIAFCSAPVLSRAASRRTSVTTSTVPAASSEMAGSWYCADMSNLLRAQNPSELSRIGQGRETHQNPDTFRMRCDSPTICGRAQKLNPGVDDAAK